MQFFATLFFFLAEGVLLGAGVVKAVQPDAGFPWLLIVAILVIVGFFVKFGCLGQDSGEH